MDNMENGFNRSRKYPALRNLIVLLKLLGWISIIVEVPFILFLLGGGKMGIQEDLLIAPVLILISVATPLSLFAAAESLKVILHIEENQRRGLQISQTTNEILLEVKKVLLLNQIDSDL